MLYLWMPEGQGKWLWRLDDQMWQASENIDDLMQAVQIHYQAKDAIVFFPSQTAQFDVKTLPRAQYKQLGVQGVQYLLEENTIEPIDHLAIFHHYAQNEVHLMAMSKQMRETYQHSLSLLPWHIQALLPDFLLVTPPHEQALNLLQVEDRIVWRWGDFRGWQCNDLSVLDLWLTDQTKIYAAGLSEKNEEILQQYHQDDAQEIQYDVVDALHSDLTKLKNHPFNALLKVKKPNENNNYWKACVALFAVALSIQVLYDGLRWWKYKKLADQTAELAVNQYQQWFPNETRVNEQNLTTQFTAKIRANASADIQALQLVSRIGPILQQANIVAKQVKYQDNSLNLQLTAKNSEHLKSLTDQFKQQGFSAELGAIQNQGNDVIGMIKVQ